jgi:type VI secretion system secreted protein VgrG
MTAASYTRARYYDPSLGRFLAEDSSGFSAGANFYGYVGNSPTGFNDSLGLSPTATVPVTSTGWTAAEEAQFQAYVQELEGAGWNAVAAIRTAFLVVTYLFDPSGDNNNRWATSQEYAFELAALRQSEYEAYKQACSPLYLRPSMDPCAALSLQIDHAKRCIGLRQAWDAKWQPNRHNDEIQNWLNRLQNLKDQHNRDCTNKCK